MWPALPLQAEDFAACWVTTVVNPISLVPDQVTRCRISGGAVVDYASDSSVPSTLYAQTGSDLTGQCWYYTSTPTSYVLLNQYANGDAEIGFAIDPSDPGGLIALGPTLPRCTSEPSFATDPSADVWEYVLQYIHDPPNPNLNPKQGDGVTGLATYVGVAVPDEHSATISSSSLSLEVFIEVSSVVVDWGDESADTYPPTATAMAGYPDGYASHVYEEKNHSGVVIDVGYDWSARWRIAGSTWEALDVPNTSTAVTYPIAEIISSLIR